MTILKEIINKNNKKKLFIFPNKKYLSYKQFYNQVLNFAKNYESRLIKTKNKIVFFATPFDLDIAKYLNKIQPIFKIASGDNNFFDLIKKILSVYMVILTIL